MPPKRKAAAAAETNSVVPAPVRASTRSKVKAPRPVKSKQAASEESDNSQDEEGSESVEEPTPAEAKKLAAAAKRAEAAAKRAEAAAEKKAAAAEKKAAAAEKRKTVAAAKSKKQDADDEDVDDDNDDDDVDEVGKDEKKEESGKKEKKDEADNEEEEEEEEDEGGDDEDAGDAPPLAKKARPAPLGQWTEIDSLFYVLDGGNPSAKIASFDMDSTLVVPRSGKRFPSGRADWVWWDPSVPLKLQQLHKDGYRLLVLTNQAGIEKKKTKAADIQGKIQDLAAAAGVPITGMIAGGTNHWRKPNTTAWEYFVQSLNGGTAPDMEKSFYCGDAAGRPKGWQSGKKKDFSCGDRKFAVNCGLAFHTPEEIFLGQAPFTEFSWGSIDPKSLLATSTPTLIKGDPTVHTPDTLTSTSQEVVILVGMPAVGKSTFARRYFVPKGYVHINQDTLKTKEKCIARASEAINEGKSVIIDNTNGDKETRSAYLTMAKQKKIPARCFFFEVDREVASHLNFYRVRMTSGSVRRVPGVGYAMYAKKLVHPSVSEGFSEVKMVQFVPAFDDARAKELFLHHADAE